MEAQCLYTSTNLSQQAHVTTPCGVNVTRYALPARADGDLDLAMCLNSSKSFPRVTCKYIELRLRVRSDRTPVASYFTLRQTLHDFHRQHRRRSWYRSSHRSGPFVVFCNRPTPIPDVQYISHSSPVTREHKTAHGMLAHSIKRRNKLAGNSVDKAQQQFVLALRLPVAAVHPCR